MKWNTRGFSSSLIKGHFCQFSKDRQGIVGLSWARMYDFSRKIAIQVECHGIGHSPALVLLH